MDSFEILRRELSIAARLSFQAFREEAPDEQFYAFALFTSDDAEGANTAANTEEGFQRALQYYAREWPSVLERGCEGEIRYSPGEWAYDGAGGDAEQWTKVWQMNDALKKDLDFYAFKLQLLETMVLSLHDLDQEGFFGAGEERDKITLMIAMGDLDLGRRKWVQSVKRLNPASVFERFIEAMPPPRERWTDLLTGPDPT